MFHELTDNDIKRRRKHIVVTACLVAALALAAFAVYSVVQESAKTQGAVALRDSILGPRPSSAAPSRAATRARSSISRKATG